MSHFCTNNKKVALKLKFRTAYFNIFLLFGKCLLYNKIINRYIYYGIFNQISQY